MTNTLYHLYQKKTLALVDSFIIKSQFTAEAMNVAVQEAGLVVNSNSPGSWRYYLHLAGILHPADDIITIVSHDTLEDIAFTPANMQIHKGTYYNYLTDPQYVRTLYAKYPLQTNYIRGVLNPIDMQRAIDAEEGDILYYDRSLVDPNEYSLMEDVQRFITLVSQRWNVPDYRNIDELYSGGYYANLFASLPGQILNMRLDRCKTPEAHSYHITEYLAGHGGLDRYIDVLHTDQVLWLYRNIKAIIAQSGKQKTLSLLIENILTKLGIPVSHYVAEHNVGQMPGKLSPVPDFIQIPINHTRVQDRDRALSVAGMLERERPCAPDNESVEPEYIPAITEAIETSPTNLLATKILESDMLDYGEYSPFTSTQTLVQHWGYLASKGRYSAYVSFNVGVEKLFLNANDAWVFFIYAIHKSLGITLTKVPRSIGQNVRKIPTPTFGELRRLASKEYVKSDVITEALADLPSIGSYVSVLGFRTDILAVHKRLQKHRLQYTTVAHHISRGMTKGVVMAIYPHVEFGNSDILMFEDWFRDRSIVIDDESLSPDDWKAIYTEIGIKAIGATNVKKSKKEIQEAAIALMRQLTSYSIQWISRINDGQIVLTENPMLKIGDATLSATINIRDKIQHDIVGHDIGFRTEVDAGIRPVLTVRPVAVTYEGRIDWSGVLNYKASLVSGHFISHGIMNFYIGGTPEEETETETEVEAEFFAVGSEPYTSTEDSTTLVNLFSFKIEEIPDNDLRILPDNFTTNGNISPILVSADMGVSTSPNETQPYQGSVNFNNFTVTDSATFLNLAYTNTATDTVGVGLTLLPFTETITDVYSPTKRFDFKEPGSITTTFFVGSGNTLE